LANIGTADNPLVMTFVPSGDTDKIVASADQIRDMLQKETGLTIKTNVATSYAAVIEALGAGNAQVAWLPTLSYIIAHQKFGVDPILIVGRFGTTTYASQVITRKDSGIKTLKDLTGKSFCRPDPLSTSGWVIPKVMLKAVGIEEAQLGKIIDSGGHGGVVTAVYNKDCDAGATFVDARGQDKEHKDVKDVVVVIDTSKAIPNDNVSVAKGLPADVVAKLKDGLVKLTTTEEGKAALKTAYSVETLEKVADSDYVEFRVTLEAAGRDPLSLMPQPK
jgi:phosphonate transport system substrate-binding protein